MKKHCQRASLDLLTTHQYLLEYWLQKALKKIVKYASYQSFNELQLNLAYTVPNSRAKLIIAAEGLSLFI